MNISEQLKKFRKINGFSVVECSEKIGVSQSTYRDWENGRAISGEPYLRISQMFGISLSALFGLEDEELSFQLQELDTALQKASNHIKNIRSRL